MGLKRYCLSILEIFALLILIQLILTGVIICLNYLKRKEELKIESRNIRKSE